MSAAYGRVPPSLYAVSSTLREVTAEKGVQYVDAVNLGWTASRPDLPDLLTRTLRTAPP